MLPTRAARAEVRVYVYRRLRPRAYLRVTKMDREPFAGRPRDLGSSFFVLGKRSCVVFAFHDAFGVEASCPEAPGRAFPLPAFCCARGSSEVPTGGRAKRGTVKGSRERGPKRALSRYSYFKGILCGGYVVYVV